MIPNFLYAIHHQLLGDHDIQDTNQVYNAMLRAVKSYTKMMKCKLQVELLKKFFHLKLGTSTVEEQVTKLCTHKDKRVFKQAVQCKLKMVAMKEKLNDAFGEYHKGKHGNNKVWREAKQKMTPRTCRNYLDGWRCYVVELKKKLTDATEKKIAWLKSRWKKKEDPIPDTYKVITIQIDGDTMYPPEFSNQPRVYGTLDINEAEEAIVSMPPKFARYQKLDKRRIRIQVEEALNKLRWNKLIDDSEPSVNFFDNSSDSFDINKLNVTSLPFNPNVMMPRAVDEQLEVSMHRFRDGVMNTVSRMDVVVQCSNLNENERAGLKSLSERVKDGDVVCCVTDKSGRWALESKQNYRDVVCVSWRIRRRHQ